MLGYSIQLGAAAALLVASLAVRATARNRHVRRRQRLTILLTLVWIAVELFISRAGYPPEVSDQIRSLAQVGLALALINFVVVVAVNPLRDDRAPEHFPVILQDTVIVTLFAVVTTVLLRERVLALSAVGAVVVGFALQDTLGNAFAGLAIQTEKPFHVGQWIRVAERDGQVAEITWRATKLRTRDNTFLIVPNNVMSREMVLNYSEPVRPTRIFVEVGATYEKPPNEVKGALLEAIQNSPLALAEPAPDVLLLDFGGSAILYRARFWIEDYGLDEIARDQVRTAIWYSFKRRGIEIPWPIQVQYERQETPLRLPDTTDRLASQLRNVEVFASLDDDDRRDLAGRSMERLYARGEVVVREGAPGRSMFVVCEGEVEVVLDSSGRRLASIGPSGFFGEMSLLAGAPRSATVRAVADSLLMEIGADEFRRFVSEKPHVLEQIGLAAMSRRERLEHARQDDAAAAHAPGAVGSFLTKVRNFLGLHS